MTIKYKKTIREKRGTRTIGYGKVGQHRKAGQRAGKGKTTGWKKSKKSYYLKQKELGFPDPDWDMGKTGFKRPQDIVRISQVYTINIKDLDLKLEEFVKQEKATKSGNAYVINLADLNIQKILGRGEINKKVNVTVKKASKNAVEKIKKAGGKVNFLFPKK
ncbi:MAG: uL15 family ribosomal protein [Candidatus Lokiarchaeota archaeon]|nr:uL15 family ribosomal protein [Candidatus Lokiarchaeota archaeon]